MDNRPIGVFDSGLGGLCAVRELTELLPKEKIIYFGDTGRIPYGTRSAETIRKYALQDARFLLSKGVKTILAACGTVSSVALEYLKKLCGVSLFGVTEDAVSAAVRASKNGRVAVIGTEATISAGVFERKLRAAGMNTVGVACPLFVSLVECGFIGEDDPCTLAACEKYLSPVRDFGADTLILGCTHYSIISPMISRVLPGVKLINPSREAVLRLFCELEEGDILSSGSGGVEYYVSDLPNRFDEIAHTFLGGNVDAERIEIEKY